MSLSQSTQNSRTNKFEHKIWSTSKIQDIFYFENDIYRVLHERSNIAAFSVEHQKFPERTNFSSEMWIVSEKLKQCYAQRKKQHRCFFRGAPWPTLITRSDIPPYQEKNRRATIFL